MLFTKEFYDLMEQFEKDAKEIVRTGHQGLNREPKEFWNKGSFYTDGRANEAFRLYQHGYAYGKSAHQ